RFDYILNTLILARQHAALFRRIESIHFTIETVLEFIPNNFLCHSRADGNLEITRILDARLHRQDRPIL
ncbi:MAG: hypothetical protein EAZ92_01210, partial [Candidatus Kapaibacterium sp.]